MFSLAAELLTHREKKPLITQKSLTEADVILYQISPFLNLTEEQFLNWFPYTYVYNKSRNKLWIRLKSKAYCEKVLLLFGVDSVENFKKKISDNNLIQNIGYPSAIYLAPKITDSIKIGEIGTIN